MNRLFRNRISKLCNAVSTRAAATQDSLSKSLQRISETDSLLYYKMTDKIECGREIKGQRRKRCKE